jgi:KipI family sensor histidine kinase inhibitor
MTRARGDAEAGPGEAASELVRLREAGPYGLLAETDSAARAQALYQRLTRGLGADALAEVEELVPGARSVLIMARPTAAGAAMLCRLVAVLPAWGSPAADPGESRLLTLPVRYDGADLAAVAELTGLAVEELIAMHAGATYTVAFCGFAPGFGYLTGLPERLRVPRLASPRTRVPAGSVGVAGEFTGVYPRASPGGWRLLGRTNAVLWDPDRDPAALLVPGTRVRFQPEDR